MHKFCLLPFFIEIFLTQFTWKRFKCLLKMNKHIYKIILVICVEKSSRWNSGWETFAKKLQTFFLVPSQRYKNFRHLFQNQKNHQSVMGFSNRAQRFTTPYQLDVDSPFQPVHINSTSSQTSASHFVSTIALVLANLEPLVLAYGLMRSRAPSFMKSRASDSVETRAHRSCVYRQFILVSNLQPGLPLQEFIHSKLLKHSHASSVTTKTLCLSQIFH